jgi:hypothetical protein
MAGGVGALPQSKEGARHCRVEKRAGILQRGGWREQQPFVSPYHRELRWSSSFIRTRLLASPVATAARRRRLNTPPVAERAGFYGVPAFPLLPSPSGRAWQPLPDPSHSDCAVVYNARVA